MMDKLAMITLLILYILVGVVSLFTYLIVRCENENKTNEERFIEDEEQMEYLSNHKKRRQKTWKKEYIKAIYSMQI